MYCLLVLLWKSSGACLYTGKHVAKELNPSGESGKHMAKELNPSGESGKHMAK